MNKRNTPQTVKQQLRREVKRELDNAIKMRVEKGSVVTSQGDVMRFTVRYSPVCPFVTTQFNTNEWISTADVASCAMYEWGYTR